MAEDRMKWHVTFLYFLDSCLLTALPCSRSDLPTKVASGTSALSDGTSEMSSMSSEMPRPSGLQKQLRKLDWRKLFRMPWWNEEQWMRRMIYNAESISHKISGSSYRRQVRRQSLDGSLGMKFIEICHVLLHEWSSAIQQNIYIDIWLPNYKPNLVSLKIIVDITSDHFTSFAAWPSRFDIPGPLTWLPPPSRDIWPKLGWKSVH